MAGDLEAVLEACWGYAADPASPAPQRSCRWCHCETPGQHDPQCPCIALAVALQHRDALAAYIRAERRSLTMQGAVRLAKPSAKGAMKRRLAESTLELEAALARLHRLGIEAMVR